MKQFVKEIEKKLDSVHREREQIKNIIEETIKNNYK
jgi:uncharacterized membrane-anchored protein